MNLDLNFDKLSLSDIKKNFEKIVKAPVGSFTPSMMDNFSNFMQVKKLEYTLQNLNKTKQVASKDVSTMLIDIKKAGYDIAKLPTKYKSIIENTYNEFKTMQKLNKSFYDNTFVSTYIDVYDTVTDPKYKNFVNGLKLEANNFSKEDIAISEYYSSIDMEQFTSESFIDSLIIKKFSFSILSAIGSAKIFFIISVIIVTLLLSILIIMGIIYLAKKMSYQRQTSTRTNFKQIDDSGYNEQVVKEIEAEGVNSYTKYLVKPAEMSKSFMNSVVLKNGFSFKNIFSKENFQPQDMVKSTESLTALGVAGIIGFIFIMIKSLRGFVYYLQHLKLQAHVYLNEQTEMLSINIDELVEKRDNTNDVNEQKRLDVIIKKQREWVDKFSELSNNLYKEQIQTSYLVEEKLNGDDARFDVERKKNHEEYQEIMKKEREKEEEEFRKKNPDTISDSKPGVVELTPDEDRSNVSVIF